MRTMRVFCGLSTTTVALAAVAVRSPDSTGLPTTSLGLLSSTDSSSFQKSSSSLDSATATACAEASAASLTAVYFGDPRLVISASLATECIKSVPLNTSLDSDLIDYLVPYVEFQSTLGYLKEPPDGYLIPGTDLVQGLLDLKQNLAENKYAMQWEFMHDLQNLFLAAGDGHLSYTPAIFSVFKFLRGASLVSPSTDGIEPPEVFLALDIENAAKHGTAAEPIAQIDGTAVVEYLENLGTSMRYQDPDARYGSLFYSKAARALFDTKPAATAAVGVGFNALAGSYVGLPDETELTYAGGRTAKIGNMAVVEGSLGGINNGEDFQLAFEIPQSTSTTSTSSSTSSKTSSVGPAFRTANPGYPPPVVTVPGAWLAGYYLDGNHSDTAVLSILSFGGLSDSGANATTELLQVANTVSEFLGKSKQAGKKKLVIDLSMNPGGEIMQAYDVYSQMFPSSGHPWDGSRYQASPALDLIGTRIYGTALGDDFFSARLSVNLTRYPTWASLYGPVRFPQANETNLVRLDLTDMGTGETASNLSSSTSSSPVFQPEDVVVISDGTCAGACTLLAGLLTREQGVRSIAFGGRPISAPMQAMGGTKGAQAVTFAAIAEAAAQAANLSPNGSADGLPDTGPPPLNPPLPSLGTCNFRNAYSRSETAANQGPPLQFVYEPADCKRFITAAEYLDIETHWAVAADVAWGGAKCVPNSTANADGTIGDGVPG